MSLLMHLELLRLKIIGLSLKLLALILQESLDRSHPALMQLYQSDEETSPSVFD